MNFNDPEIIATASHFWDLLFKDTLLIQEHLPIIIINYSFIPLFVFNNYFSGLFNFAFHIHELNDE